ncbi:MAG: hypothetical protein AAFN70_04205 [Planctomycetota bacterium]
MNSLLLLPAIAAPPIRRFATILSRTETISRLFREETSDPRLWPYLLMLFVPVLVGVLVWLTNIIVQRYRHRKLSEEQWLRRLTGVLGMGREDLNIICRLTKIARVRTPMALMAMPAAFSSALDLADETGELKTDQVARGAKIYKALFPDAKEIAPGK